MGADSIQIADARQNNLRGITVSIPRRRLTVITGPSGSGKSSLAFDTLYAEGQRRYVESLSTYAKQFLERMSKPDVGRIEGISPAVAIEQKNPTTSSRSTVGTATEIHDYLRLLWARIGRPHCPRCGQPITSDSPSTATNRLLETHAGSPAMIGFPLPASTLAAHELILENLRGMGFVRVRVDKTVYRLDELPAEIRLDRDPVTVLVDRLDLLPATRARIADSLSTAFAEGNGVAVVITDTGTITFSQHPRCAGCGLATPPLTPALFSFNNPRGACPGCNGFGAVLEYDESLIIPDPAASLAGGAIDPWTKPRYVGRRRTLREFARREDIPFDVPWRDLTDPQRHLLLYAEARKFTGIVPFLRGLEPKRYKQYIRVFLRQYQKARTCGECGGTRLRPEARAVFIHGTSIGDLAAQTATEVDTWVSRLELDDHDRLIAETILRELSARTSYLCDVGLGYLNLDRQTRTLSGGEAQRIALSNALGSNLVETLYVLDEPSIGLHPRDVRRLLSLLERLRDAGNTVVVVEHDPETIRLADHMIELGPGSGDHGGQVVFSGSVEQAIRSETLTGSFLAGSRRIPVPASRRVPMRWLTLKGASLHNVHNLDVDIPLDTLTVVTGVSGSGKSTLVHDILYRRMELLLHGGHGAKEHLGEAVGSVDAVEGVHRIDDVVLIDQSPIGRTPRSNPITYVKAFDEIRELFAAHPLSRQRGYTPATFSFNTADGGRCPVCEGAGHIQVEMVFLADVFVPCESCATTRFKPEVLDVKIHGQSIAQALELTVDQAVIRFRHQEKLGRALWHLQQVGLGYLRLGQPATTLSGGEAQRLKIARQLIGGSKRERRLYILDEPTTGLHMSDVNVLCRVLDRLVDSGHSVVVIEHNLDLIKRADWIIDMGPEGGPAGGRIVAAGTPEDVARADTHTGRFLARALAEPAGTPATAGAA